MARLRIDIVTAERSVYSDEVDMVIAPATLGQVGILPRHAPMLTTLSPGELRIKKGAEEIDMAVSGGFMEVLPDRVIVLADTAERADEIDLARAEATLQRARTLLTQRGAAAPTDLARAEAALRRSQVRLRVARRRRPE